MKLKRFCSLLVLGTSLAHAANWQNVGYSSTGINYELDTDRVTLYTGPIWRGWVRADAGLAKPKPQYSKGMYQYEVNCRESTYRVLTTVLYNKDGEPIENSDTPASIHRSVVPESMSESVKEGICNVALSRGFGDWLEKQKQIAK